MAKSRSLRVASRLLRVTPRSFRRAAGLLALALSGCCSCPRPAEDFATPAAAIRTFQAALEKRDSDALYRCLSEGFKQRANLSAVATDIALEYMLREHPEIKYLEDGAIVGEQRLDPHHAMVEVEVGFLFFTRLVRFVLERQTLAELQRERTPAPISVFLAPGSRVQSFTLYRDDSMAIRLEGVPDLAEQLEMDEPPITSFRVMDVWKVHALAVEPEAAETTGESASAARSADAEQHSEPKQGS